MDAQYLLSFLLALALSLVMIPFLIRHSARLGLVDDPSVEERKQHDQVMPRSGGLGIILAAALALLMVLPIDESLASLVLGGLIITSFGLIDDMVSLRAIYKLLGQVLGVCVAMNGGMVIADVPFFAGAPDWLCYAITLVFVVGVINAVNFSDGMDGLAAGITLMALLLIFILAVESGNTPVGAIALAVAAAVIGFLRFNTHPASIFMGDAGSQFLGFVVAWLAIGVSQAEISPMTRLMPLLVLGIPVLDMVQVIPVRLSKGLAPWHADRRNFHYQVANLGFHQYEVVAIIYALQAVLLSSAYLLRFASDGAVLGFYLVYALVVLGLVYRANERCWRIHAPRDEGQVDHRNRYFRRLSVYHPYTGKLIGLLIGLFLIAASLMASDLPQELVYASLLWAFVLLGIKLFSRNLWPLAFGRLATYTVSAIAVYGLTVSVHSPSYNLLINIGLAGLAVLIALAIRLTRREYFWLTTQDLLVVLFLAILAPNLPGGVAQEFPTGVLIFRTVVLLYGCEYLMARGDSARYRITNVAIFAAFFIGVHIF